MCNDFDINTPNDVATLQIPPSSAFQSQGLRAADMGSRSDSAQFPNGTVMRDTEAAESAGMERLVTLKGELREEADIDTFWERLLDGVASICNAQCAFVAKTPRRDTDQSGANGLLEQETSSFPDEIRVRYNCDCNEFRQNDCTEALRTISHGLVASDQVTLVPRNLGSITSEHLSGYTFPMEACLAVPLFSGGMCFAHFGVMWTHEGLEQRHVSWSHLQMILHSLEDLILLRVSTQGTQRRNGYHRHHEHQHHRKQSKRKEREWDPTQYRNTSSNKNPAPYHPATSPPSFKPYARSLSHELRTPMQGVVGMLEVMHATVQDTMVANPGSHIVSVFQDLRDNIEAVQDSARRAIEAADNVVHAYDLNMQVPETPLVPGQENSQKTNSLPVRKEASNCARQMVIEGSDIHVPPPKRARNNHADWSYTSSSQATPNNTKTPPLDANSYSNHRPILTADVKSVVEESDKIVHATPQRQMEEVLIDAVAQRPQLGHERPTSPKIAPEPVFPPMVLQHTKIRDLLHLVINESLHVGGRPESTIAESTDLGERIEIRSRSSSGQASTKVIDWSVDSSVPETLFFDEKDLAKLVSCIFLNALKFTEAGNITIKTTLNEANRYIMINVCDTGTGIPATFLPKLFQAFSREDGSTTRSKEGLGLGLLVAKGLSRRLGGDLTCVRSSTTEPDRGSEFEIRLPMYPNECVTRPATPYAGTPAPSPADSRRSPAVTASPEGEPSQQGHATQSSIPVVEEQSSLPDSLCRPQLASVETANQDDDNTNTNNISSAPSTQPNHSRLPIANRRMSVASRNSYFSGHNFDPDLAQKQPLTFLVAEDNKINRKILVSMLGKLGYKDVYEAFDGKEAVRIMSESLSSTTNTDTNTNSSSASTNSDSDTFSTDTDTSNLGNNDTTTTNPESPIKRRPIDVILMDLWMPYMDGYEATERILNMISENNNNKHPEPTSPTSPTSPTVLAVSADVTDEALRRATAVGMKGYMTKPYKLRDLGRLIMDFGGRTGTGENGY